MYPKKWADKEDCEIARYYFENSGQVTLRDGFNGNKLFTVPSLWTDEQIWECLRIANIAYSDGYKSGEQSKAKEITTALFLEER